MAHHILPNPWKPRPLRTLYSEAPLRPNISFQTSRSTDGSTDRFGLGILGRGALTASTEAPCDSPTPEGFPAILLGQVRLGLFPWRLNADRGVREGTEWRRRTKGRKKCLDFQMLLLLQEAIMGSERPIAMRAVVY